MGWINEIGNGAVWGCRLIFWVEEAGVSVGVVDANGNPPAVPNLISSESIILNRPQNWGERICLSLNEYTYVGIYTCVSLKK